MYKWTTNTKGSHDGGWMGSGRSISSDNRQKKHQLARECAQAACEIAQPMKSVSFHTTVRPQSTDYPPKMNHTLHVVTSAPITSTRGCERTFKRNRCPAHRAHLLLHLLTVRIDPPTQAEPRCPHRLSRGRADRDFGLCDDGPRVQDGEDREIESVTVEAV